MLKNYHFEFLKNGRLYKKYTHTQTHMYIQYTCEPATLESNIFDIWPPAPAEDLCLLYVRHYEIYLNSISWESKKWWKFVKTR